MWRRQGQEAAICALLEDKGSMGGRGGGGGGRGEGEGVLPFSLFLFFLSLYLSLCLSIFLSLHISLSPFPLHSFFRSLSLSLFLSFFPFSRYFSLSLPLSFFLSNFQYFCLFLPHSLTLSLPLSLPPPFFSFSVLHSLISLARSLSPLSLSISMCLSASHSIYVAGGAAEGAEGAGRGEEAGALCQLGQQGGTCSAAILYSYLLSSHCRFLELTVVRTMDFSSIANFSSVSRVKK